MRVSALPQRRSRDSGFTLLELVAVIAIIAALSVVVVVTYRRYDTDANFNSLAETVQRIQSMIRVASVENGGPPSTVDANLLGSLPVHPWEPDHASPIWTDNTATANQIHPANKRISPAGCFWYNPANGTFRALVAPGGAPGQIQHYNRIHGANISDASATQ